MLPTGSKPTSSLITLPLISIASLLGTRSQPPTPSLPASCQPFGTFTKPFAPKRFTSMFRPRLIWTCWGCHSHRPRQHLETVCCRLLYRSWRRWWLTGHHYWLMCTRISLT
ncbi:hypothetical protein LINPERHAP1_LOCUS20126 [Linum perenne]